MAPNRRCLLRVPPEGQIATRALTDASLLNEVDTFHGTNLCHRPQTSSVQMVPWLQLHIEGTLLRFSPSAPSSLLKRVSRERMTDRSSTLLPFASKLSWNPINEDLLGLFLDGYLFWLHVLDGTIEARVPDSGRMP